MKGFRAFTLVEVAIILVVIGLLLGLGASLIGVLTKRVKYTESKEEVRKAVEALKGYAIRFGYLPSARNETVYNATSPDPAFNTVGVRGFDAWGKALLYRVSGNLIQNSTDLCSLNSTNFSITDQGQFKSNLAFMIISGGLNYNIQTNLTLYLQDTPNIDDFPYDFTRQERYDDLVEYVSLFELQKQRCNYAAPGYCSSLGVTLDQNINSYRKSGGTCTSGTFISLNQADYIETYGGSNCHNLCGNFTFTELIAYDTDKNCKVIIIRQGNVCQPSNQ
ncbi:MAG: hypothetical protein NZ530_01160 [Thermodesulfobacteriaceae bacterium]|nr:hypothetical protein [Thermodesulfobacteriaceae bacterium]MCX8041020.1 hypothetical protein [Thermodesulfobacteriaceae bacterium]MDW8135259.1 hypothetical protein [Thermodesulfobacterium sp.]